LVCTLQACGAATLEKSDAERRPTQVGFVVVSASSVPVVTELSGRVAAFQLSEVRPQVEGLIRRRLFTEGSIVRQGETLFEIDPRIYQASAAQARANLDSAAASAQAARVRADRLRPLAEIEAVSKQDYTDALAQSRQASAAVTQSRAQLNTAQINLGFTRVPAPITGRIGRALATEGALVTSNQAGPLAVIQRLDPVYVDIQQSSAELLAMRRALASGGAAAGDAEVRLILEDGSAYELSGRVSFSETIVDPATGTVTLRARFPNPAGLLLPGMFVRARFVQSVNTRAYLVPQAALRREPNGGASVFVVGPNNRAIQRNVVADRTQGADWVVTRGLADGDRIITQGGARLRARALVPPVPVCTPQRIAPPQPQG
jgi:membrane fusion protein, multidrug efflux system